MEPKSYNAMLLYLFFDSLLSTCQKKMKMEKCPKAADSPLSHWNQKRVWSSSWIRIKSKWTIIGELNHSLVDWNDCPINSCILLWLYHSVDSTLVKSTTPYLIKIKIVWWELIMLNWISVIDFTKTFSECNYYQLNSFFSVKELQFERRIR